MLRKIFCLLAVLVIFPSFPEFSHAINDLSSFSVFATDSIWIRQGATVKSGKIGVKNASLGLWPGPQSEVIIGKKVYMPDGTSIYADTVKIKINASVDDVHYNELMNLGTIRGNEYTPLQMPLDISLPDFPAPAPGTENHDLPRGETLVLEPGAYGEILVRANATLILTGGTYHFENLDLGYRNAKVFFQAPTDLIINNRLEPGLNAVIGPADKSGISAKDIRIYVNGINGTRGNLGATPKAATIGCNNSLKANIYAPNGTILIKQGSVAEGAFIGKNVQIGSSVEVDENSGFGEAPITVSIAANPKTISVGETANLAWNSTNADFCFIEPGIGIVQANGTYAVSPTQTTVYSITASGPYGTIGDRVTVHVAGNPELQPEGSFGQQYEDLVPPDATVEEYDPKRFSVITGLVQDLAETPIADVAITIHSHPEYGTVTTDAEGRFSIPVEGGATMTVVYQKDGLVPGQRKVYVTWNDIAIPETIQMIAEDPAATILTFDGNPDTVVTHQSTPVTDEFGSRSASIVFTGDNRAYLVDENGNDIQELTTITARATEFATEQSMPAKLPPNSAYTYCVELSVDGAQRIRFEKPVIIWVDNFLGFDVGMAAPVGYYDRDRGVWVPADNGVVVKLLDTDADGSVDALDADGDDQPDDLNGNGFFNDEVTGLYDPGRYAPGFSFWRVAITHFTPWDINWPFGPPTDSIPPNPNGEVAIDEQKNEEDDCQKRLGSFVEARSRVFHEDIPIPGTDLTLHYAINRVPGYLYRITVPASGETVPESLKRIIARVEVAGRVYEQIIDPLPNQSAEFGWDGKDHLGRRVIGSTTAHVEIGFVYDIVYLEPRELIRAFAQAGRDETAVIARMEITSWKRNDVDITIPPISAQGGGVIAEGWTLSAHHQVNLMDLSTLHKGDGTQTRNNTAIVDTMAGNGTNGYSGDGGSATEAQITQPYSVYLDAEGNLYIADFGNHCIRKVDSGGIITTVAGTSTPGYSGDGGPANEASLYYPTGVTADASGNIYIADYYNNRVRKVDKSGIITTVAGTATPAYSGDGGSATEASLNHPYDVAVDASGNLYISDSGNQCIRKVDTGGIITTVAGNGNNGYSGDGGFATDAQFKYPLGMAVDLEGNLYIADVNNHRVRKVDKSGIITTVAGNGTPGYSGDGGPATEASIYNPRGLAVDSAGDLYIAGFKNRVVRKVNTKGIISTVAGKSDSEFTYGGDGGPATEALFNTIMDVAVDALNNIYIADNNGRIRKVAPPSAFANITSEGDLTFAEENGLGYIASSSGRHKTTIDLDTGVTLYDFGYDSDGRLASITDRFGNQTIISRDSSGSPTSIISPDGIYTSLTIDANNHLTWITYPDDSYYTFEYAEGGLITAKVEPEGNRFEYSGLIDVYDEEGGHWNYNRIVNENGDILIQVLTAEGNLNSYLDRTDSTGAYSSTITDPTGAQTLFTQSADGLTVNKSLPCGMELEFKYDVDYEYKYKYVKEMRESAPSGLEWVTLRDKAYQDTDADEAPDMITETVTINGKTTTLEHNTLQARKLVTSPEGRSITSLYDPATLLVESVSVPGLHSTAYGYDSRGRLTSISTNARQTTFAYNAQGFPESITNPENYTTTYSYDPVGRITGISRPDDGYVGFTYDKNGNMTVLTNPVDINHGFGFNSVNLYRAYTTPLSGSYSYVYDKDRRLIQTNFPSGKQIFNIWDKTRLSQIQTPEGNIDFTYLCGTKVESITKDTESITYGYDGKLVTLEMLSGTLNQSLNYTYNNDFDVSSFTYAGGTVSYDYDNDGLLTAAGSYSISRNTQNGLPEAVTGGALSLSRAFNGYGEVEGQNFTVGSQNVTTWILTRDDNGRIINKTETVGSVTTNYAYTYDSMGRLLTVTKDGNLVEAYGYDLSGTRISETNTLRGFSVRSFSYSAGDHLLSAGSMSYSYNLDGFLTTKKDGDDVTNYKYSSRGELLSVDLSDGRVIEYLHDPLGRRIAKKVDGVVVEKYLWEGLTRLLAVYDGSNNLLMRFEYADDRMPVAMKSGGTTYFLTYDQVGSLRVVADASGNVVELIEYDSFGNIINDTNPTIEVPFGFAGGLDDRDTGLVRFGFRDYDPDTGRWTAKDPIFFAGGDTDLYGYCLNDPINAVDPRGLFGGQAALRAFLYGAPLLIGALGYATGADLPDVNLPDIPYIPSEDEAEDILFDILMARGEDSSACPAYESRGMGDEYGPLWDAPGMPGWSYPSNDPNDPDFMKEPNDYDKWSKWKKFKWQAKKFAAKIFSAFHNP
ncbi:MAG: hypothetical protein JSV31_11845 [Desulfobacterales bacterium]|nr:MAG: hypothetical protein JSV31_11845 [Desulfobacterales bacterium]